MKLVEYAGHTRNDIRKMLSNGISVVGDAWKRKSKIDLNKNCR